jgi:hypothetical protein
MSVAGVTTTNTAWIQDFQYISGTDLYGGSSFTPPGALFEKRAIYVPATTGTFTLNVAGGNTPGVFTAGATVNVVNSATKTFTGLPSGTEVRVRRGSKTLATDPNVTTGSYAFTYAPDDRGATVQFTLPGYVFEDIVVTLNATSQELPIVSSPDPSYSAT